jgi:hypothetical protein
MPKLVLAVGDTVRAVAKGKKMRQGDIGYVTAVDPKVRVKWDGRDGDHSTKRDKVEKVDETPSSGRGIGPEVPPGLASGSSSSGAAMIGPEIPTQSSASIGPEPIIGQSYFFLVSANCILLVKRDLEMQLYSRMHHKACTRDTDEVGFECTCGIVVQTSVAFF